MACSSADAFGFILVILVLGIFPFCFLFILYKNSNKRNKLLEERLKEQEKQLVQQLDDKHKEMMEMHSKFTSQIAEISMKLIEAKQTVTYHVTSNNLTLDGKGVESLFNRFFGPVSSRMTEVEDEVQQMRPASFLWDWGKKAVNYGVTHFVR